MRYSQQKRLFDLVVLFAAMPLILPLFLAVCVSHLIFMGHPVFFISERMCGPDTSFRLVKFRTMSLSKGKEEASGGHQQTRVTPFGAVLRKYRLDEIPQVLNVLKGDMSLVGPRPPLRKYVDRHKSLYASVLKSKPGITGLATLYFHRHENYLLSRCRSAAETDEIYSRRCVPMKAKLDIIYSQRGSICFDLLILIKTAIKLISR